MSHYTERFENHPIHAELENLVKAIESARSSLKLEASDQRLGYARFLRVVRFIKSRISQYDPSLATLSILNSLQAKVHALRTQHTAFLSDKNWQALNEHADAGLDQIFRVPSSRIEVSDANASIDDFIAHANSEVERLKQGTDTVLADSTTRLESLKKTADDVSHRFAQHDQQFEAQKGRIDGLITESSSRFTEAERERTERYSKSEMSRQDALRKSLEDAKQQFDTVRENVESSFHGLEERQEESGSNLIQTLQERLKEAERIVGLIGNTGMSGGYQIVANNERHWANVFRWLAIVFFTATVLVVVWVVHGISTDDFRWEVALLRIAVAATLVAPAIYCAKESSRHRAFEHRTRRIELELASITPYLHALSADQSQEVMKDLAKKYFGNEHNGEVSDGEFKLRSFHLRGDQMLQVIERIAKAVK